MNTIKQLIEKYCPEGVEYKKLSELAQLIRGRVISKEYLRDNPGPYPVYSSQTANNGKLGSISTFDYEGEYLTWTTDGAYAGTIFYRNGRFNITNVCGLINLSSRDVLLRFLYYWLSIEAPKHVYKGMGNPKLMSNQMAFVEIPVPPLSVQREIVRILDNFTSLEAELEAELEARKKQYEYYRDQLLSFKHLTGGGKNNVEWKTLGEVAEIKRGIRVVKKELENNGKYPVYQNSLTPLGYMGEYNSPADTTFVIIGGAAGEIGYSSIPFWAADDCLSLRPKDNLISKYAFHWLMANYDSIKHKVRKASVPRLSRAVIEKLPIPIPPLSEQHRIVSILDRFESLVNDITTGLPAEIAARHQQYEYYRDQLLTFKRK